MQYDKMKEIIDKLPKESNPQERDRISAAPIDLFLALQCARLLSGIPRGFMSFKLDTEKGIIHLALINCLVISYGRPFTKNRGQDGSTGTLYKEKYIPKEFWELHKKL